MQYGAVTSADLVHWTDISDQIKLPSGIRHDRLLNLVSGGVHFTDVSPITL